MKVTKEYLLETTAVTLVNLIPAIGGSITGIWGNYQAERKEQRFKEFIEAVNADVTILKEKVNRDYIHKDDFLDIFEHTSRKIMSERSKVKRHAFKNNFVNGMIAETVDYDIVEIYEKVIDTLSQESIYILLAINNPTHYNLTENYVEGGFGSGSLIIKLFPQLPSHIVTECVMQLQIQQLLSTWSSSGYPRNVAAKDLLKGELTERGRRFSDYISEIVKD